MKRNNHNKLPSGRSARHITKTPTTCRPGLPKKPQSKADRLLLAKEDKARRQGRLKAMLGEQG
jgi:hypothetical protein